MPRRRGHILLIAVCAALCLAGCSGARVIPKKDLIPLYEDMFIADQWLKEHSEARAVADTTLFFDPIFRRHGYSFEDYRKSIEYYSGKTEDLREVMDSVTARLKKRADYYQKLSDRIREVNEENERRRVQYTRLDFDADSAIWAADGILWPQRDSLAAADSLAAGVLAVVDSTAVVADSLGFAAGLSAAPTSLPVLEAAPERLDKSARETGANKSKAGLRSFDEREMKEN